MKKMKYSKITIVAVTIITLILLSSPSVFAGAFKLNIYPPTTPIQPGIEMREIRGVHQNIPTIFDNLLPNLWASQYTFIEVDEKPSWASVTFPDSTPITPPDGVEYELTGIVTVSEDAPAYDFGMVKLSITTGKFARTIFPWIPGLGNEFKMDQSFQIQAGYIPSLSATNPLAVHLPPNSFKNVSFLVTNTANAKSTLEFSVQQSDIPAGWNVITPGPNSVDAGDQVKILATVYAPEGNESVDEWVHIPLNIHIKSVAEPTGASADYAVTITAHCVSDDEY
ncbi:MAG: hypothetical protein KGY50_00055 [Candidatus Thermoplasmatota archaeon]|nr:hypothetical protein [Candidatus Thermoplasmatota archaeon]